MIAITAFNPEVTIHRSASPAKPQRISIKLAATSPIGSVTSEAPLSPPGCISSRNLVKNIPDPPLFFYKVIISIFYEYVNRLGIFNAPV